MTIRVALLPSLLGLACTSASAAPELAAEVGPRGEVTTLRVGQTEFLRDLGVAIIKPAWEGSHGDQRTAQPAKATQAAPGGAEEHWVVDSAEPPQWRLRATVRKAAAQVGIDHELVPLPTCRSRRFRSVG